MDLIDHQFEVGGVVFGAGCPIEVENWKPSSASWRTQDKDRSRTDGVRPGRDTRGAANWAFDAFANGEDPSCLDDVAELGGVWPDAVLRDTPGAMTPLRYRLAGRTRRVYGRPREYDYPIDTRYLSGMVPVTMNFNVMDPLIYDDVEEVYDVSAVPVTTGGLRSPVRAPVRSIWTAQAQQRLLTVGGTTSTWASVTITGGATVNPRVDIVSTSGQWMWSVQAMGSFAYDDEIVFDPRPWVRSSTVSGRRLNVSRDTRLLEMKLPAGRYFATLLADGAQGAPTATVRWRNARTTI